MSGPVRICGYYFEPAPDKWDRLYGVDFFLMINTSYIGIQVKPRTFQSSSVMGRYKGTLRTQHRRFAKEFGGQVFTVVREAGDSEYQDPALCKYILDEIARLKRRGKSNV